MRRIPVVFSMLSMDSMRVSTFLQGPNPPEMRVCGSVIGAMALRRLAERSDTDLITGRTVDNTERSITSSESSTRAFPNLNVRRRNPLKCVARPAGLEPAAPGLERRSPHVVEAVADGCLQEAAVESFCAAAVASGDSCGSLMHSPTTEPSTAHSTSLQERRGSRRSSVAGHAGCSPSRAPIESDPHH